MNAEDSVAIVSNYVEQWIRQMVLLDKAEKNIKDNFDRQLTEYKNSLLTYAYEQQIVNQLLDTTVTQDQMLAYYEDHRDDFLLHNAVVRAAYIALPDKHPATAELKKLFAKRDFAESDVSQVEEIASHHGLHGHFDAGMWMPFYNLQRVVPITTFNENLFLKQNSNIITQDEQQTYLVRIIEYKVSNDPAPFELVADDIHALLLNHRKLEILSHLQTDLLAEAEKSNNVKRYIHSR